MEPGGLDQAALVAHLSGGSGAREVAIFGLADAVHRSYDRWARAEERGWGPEDYAAFGAHCGDAALLLALGARYVHEVRHGGHGYYLDLEGEDPGVHPLLLETLARCGDDALLGELRRAAQALEGELSPARLTALDARFQVVSRRLREGLDAWGHLTLGVPVPTRGGTPEERFQEAVALTREALAQARTIEVPLHLYELLEAWPRLAEQLGRAPTVEELARATGRETDTVRRHYATLAAFDAPRGQR